MTGTPVTSIDQAVTAMTLQTGKYLTFSLENESYGIGILTVKEIIGMMPITKVPKTPENIKGVINLRGKVIPVIDLRMKFNLPETAFDDRTCIIIVELDSDDETMLVGIIVDSVSEVLNIGEGDVDPPPEFGAHLDTRYIIGIAKTDDGVKILLDINQVISTQEMAAIQDAS